MDLVEKPPHSQQHYDVLCVKPKAAGHAGRHLCVCVCVCVGAHVRVCVGACVHARARVCVYVCDCVCLWLCPEYLSAWKLL